MSLWEQKCVKDAIARMNPETRLKYKRIGEAMYNSIDFCDPETITLDYAASIKIMLRDGMLVNDLTTDEKNVFVSVYGQECLDEYDDTIKQPKKKIIKKIKTKRIYELTDDDVTVNIL